MFWIGAPPQGLDQFMAGLEELVGGLIQITGNLPTA
jgi:hypothetical protein